MNAEITNVFQVLNEELKRCHEAVQKPQGCANANIRLSELHEVLRTVVENHGPVNVGVEPEVGKWYYVVTPYDEVAVLRIVTQLTGHTVKIEDSIGNSGRFPRHRVEFIEEVTDGEEG